MRVLAYLLLAILSFWAMLMGGCVGARFTGSEVGHNMIPQIDLNRPARTEKAAFALG